MEPTQPTEGLDPKAVEAASKVMRALKAEHEARQAFEEAVSEAVQAGANAAIVRDDHRQRRATADEMMGAAQAHRQAENAVSLELGKLLRAAVQARYLQIITPGEFAFGFDEQPGTEQHLHRVHPLNGPDGRVPAGVRCLCHDEDGTPRGPCPYDQCMTTDLLTCPVDSCGPACGHGLASGK